MSARSPKHKRSVGTARQHQRRLKLLFEHLEDRRMLATYVVDHEGDSGVGSLRQAILDANANPGPEEIVFDISGGGQHTIQPLSALPNITDAVAIQGETQPGLELNSNDWLFLHWRGDAYRELGRHAEAIEDYTKVWN